MDDIERLSQFPPITNVEEGEAYIRRCVRIVGPGYHPDESGEGYVAYATGLPTFTPAQARRFNARHREVFALTGGIDPDTGDLIGFDPYRIGLNELHTTAPALWGDTDYED
jgi:hypothetical protein